MAKPGTKDHVKFKRLRRLLNLPTPQLLGHLELIWSTAQLRGRPEVGDADDVEAAAEWEGERGDLAAALYQCRWIDDVGGVYCVHDFWDHCPETLKRRQRRRTRKDATPAEVEATADVDEQDTRPAPTSAPADDSPVLLTFPCLPGAKGNPSEWLLTERVFSEHAELFPGVSREELLQHLREALGWIRTNRKKTYQGMPSFIGKWLRNNVNRRPRSGGPPPPSGSSGPAPFHRELK